MKYIKLFEATFIETKSFEYISDLDGTTPVKLYIDNKTNKKYVVKFGVHEKHMYNEYLSNKLYSKYGIKTPTAYIGLIDGKKVLITEYLENSIPLDFAIDSNPKILKKVNKGFIFDVLFGNYDVFGEDIRIENIRVLPNGDVYRVDLGGSLLYRAQGKEKDRNFSSNNHKTFSNVAVEVDSLRDPILTLHEVFFNIKDSDIKKDILKLSKEYVVNGKINVRKFLEDLHYIIYDNDIKIDKKDRKYIIKTIFNRALYLYNRFSKI